jgi:uncharacterized protein YggT (Ycf19 family)
MIGHLLSAQWQYLLPNAVLSAAIYLLIARCCLSLLFDASNSNALWRIVRAVTDPIVRPVGYVTPQIVPQRLIPLFAIAWLLAARILLRVAVLLWARPRLGSM